MAKKLYWWDSRNSVSGKHTEIKRAELADPTGVETLISTNYASTEIALYS